MAQLRRSSLISTDSRPEFDELDHLPLLSRRKLLLASKTTAVSCVDVAVKIEEEDNEGLISLSSACAVGRGTDQQMAVKQSHDDEAHAVVTSEAANGDILENSTVADQCLQKACCGEPAEVKVENSDNHVFGSLGDCVNDFAGINAPASKVNTDIPNDFADDDIDHIVLKERQRMLLKRRSMELGKGVVEGNSIGLSEYLIGPGSGRIKEETKPLDVESSVGGDDCKEMPAKNASGPGIGSVNDSSEVNAAGLSFTSKQCLEIPSCSLVTEATKTRNDMDNSERAFSDFSSYGGQLAVPRSGSVHVPTMQTSLEVKVEPLENINLLQSEKNVLSNFSFNGKPVKSETGTTNELYGDAVDHIRLQDRVKRLTSEENYDLCSSRNPALQNSHVVSETAKPISVSRLRKRKKTATDSVETAMEEDAPGLLQVLVEQGVSVDEIKLYGEVEDDDALDETFNEDSFSELEAVMTKLFFQRNSMLKFTPVRCAKGSKSSYCLACLFSLVEQTRYLQFRKWPVEWGWCRDLQSFIFVFKRHNRLVLERPEYGYATYFFELVDSLPIDWQIKRLVTAMKLSSCGRVNLIENKSLLVGEDLTEGEAKVLMGFGWVPNTGLGTMLNYCDRVFHDRKNEKETSEWRSKIGKLLVDGYNGGTIVSTNIPGNIAGYTSDGPQIKLEL